jgi:hypothetical protein
MLAEATLLVALTVEYGPGAEACLREPKLKHNVERRLRRRVFADLAESQLRFVVTYTHQEGETEARIDVSSADGTPRGTRTLATSSHCSALDDSLALSVALLADQPPEPELPEPTSPPSLAAPPSTPPPAPVPRRPAPTPISIPEEVAAPREPWHLSLGVGALGAWGLLPGVAPALSAQVRVGARHFAPITLTAELFAQRDAERNEASGARFRLTRVGLSVCPPLVASAGRVLSVCVGQKIGWLRVDGFGFDRDSNERRLLYALHLGAEVRQALFSVFSLRGALGAEVPLVRDRFVSLGRDSADLFRPSIVALTAQIGVEASLW